MDRLIVVIFAVTVIGVSFSYADPKEKPKYDEKNLIGSWKIVKGLPDKLKEKGWENRLKFTSTQILKVRAKQNQTEEVVMGDWKLNGSTLSITQKKNNTSIMPDKNGKSERTTKTEIVKVDDAEIKKLTSSKLQIAITENNDTMTLDLEKVIEHR